MIELSYWDNFFSFEFAALDFTNPQSNKCRYMLEGIDKNWVDAGNENVASYTNIQPGEYIFRVIGSNNDGIWNNTGKAIKVIIYPPWWQTFWLRAGAILAFLVFIGIFLNRKYANLKKEHKNKEEFARQLILSQEQERKTIALELHDSLVQDLLVVKNKASLAIRYPDLPDKYKITFRDISEGISGSMDMVREISHKLKPHEIERFGLTRSLEILAEKVNSSGSIIFTSNLVNINNLLSENDEVNLFRIAQECINNILKHSEANKAHIETYKDEKYIRLSIKDNGRGFDENTIKNSDNILSFGLSGIYERVNLMKGKVSLKTGIGDGTVIEIIIPLI
jgi:signal transduction histidine kinase